MTDINLFVIISRVLCGSDATKTSSNKNVDVHSIRYGFDCCCAYS